MILFTFLLTDGPYPLLDRHSIPLSLYIHAPWCVQKCPYCDFNSHPKRGQLPENKYIEALLAEAHSKLQLIGERPIQTVFIGGGTPSLLSPEAYATLFSELRTLFNFKPSLEMTLEANPGTVEASHFEGYRKLGINRLSLGVQSLQDEKLKKLGRIHTAREALAAIEIAKKAGFTDFNLDLMFGLPQQTSQDALEDLEKALATAPTHLSWYQLTLEPNTVFYKYPPVLPDEDYLWEMQCEGQTLLKKHLEQYEISAYSQKKHQCQHNLNYWRFGDYLGLGAGAHSKITLETGEITRFENTKHPTLYINAAEKTKAKVCLTEKDLGIEFMLNACRLSEEIPFELFTQRTGLHIQQLRKKLDFATQNEFITLSQKSFKLTEKGHQYLNLLLEHEDT